MGERPEVGFLSGTPWWLWVLICVCATIYNFRDSRPELRADVIQTRPPALILTGVMEESADCLVLIASVFENETSHRQEVRYIGDSSILASLIRMRDGCVNEGSLETAG